MEGRGHRDDEDESHDFLEGFWSYNDSFVGMSKAGVHRPTPALQIGSF
jgi:hypothetical protein